MNVAEELERLARLLDEGKLTRGQYEQAVSRLLQGAHGVTDSPPALTTAAPEGPFTPTVVFGGPAPEWLKSGPAQVTLCEHEDALADALEGAKQALNATPHQYTRPFMTVHDMDSAYRFLVVTLVCFTVLGFMLAVGQQEAPKHWAWEIARQCAMGLCGTVGFISLFGIVGATVLHWREYANERSAVDEANRRQEEQGKCAAAELVNQIALATKRYPFLGRGPPTGLPLPDVLESGAKLLSALRGLKVAVTHVHIAYPGQQGDAKALPDLLVILDGLSLGTGSFVGGFAFNVKGPVGRHVLAVRSSAEAPSNTLPFRLPGPGDFDILVAYSDRTCGWELNVFERHPDR
jgi:hypothetical protein